MNIHISLLVQPNATVVGEEEYSFGDDLELECTVLGGPGNIFRWIHNGQTLERETSGTLMVTNVTFMSGGEYTCIVRNAAGNDTASQTVSVRPYFISPPVDSGDRLSSSVSLNCVAGAYPTPRYSWMKIGDTIRDGVMGVNTSTLTFQSLQLEDQGDYVCIAVSSGNTIQSEAATVTG